ncbi:MAG: dockerin type I domain-containing protein [Nanoarchaeota archaeon]
MKRAVIFVLFLFFMNGISAVAYSSAATGNWNTATTWSPNGIPGNGDSVTINSGNTITVSDSRTIGTGSATSITNNGVLTVSGSLILNGDIAMNANSVFNMNPGSSLTMNSFNVLSTGKTTFNFVGTSGSRITVVSSGGAFTGGLNNVVNFQYVDFTGLGASSFYFGTDAASGITMKNSRWINYGDILFNPTNAANVFDISNSDFRPSPTATEYMGISSASRNSVNVGVINSIKNSTFYSPNYIPMNMHGFGLTFQGNVVANTYYVAFKGSQNILDNFFWKTNSDINLIYLTNQNTVSNNYIYMNTPNSHTIQGNSNSNWFNITNNVFESLGNGANNVLNGVGNYYVFKNVMIADGALMTATFANTGGTEIVKRNTVYSTQNGVVGFLYGTETQVHTAAATVLVNNLVVDSQPSTADGCVQVAAQNTQANQITFTDYNLFRNCSLVYTNVLITGKTQGIDYGFGRFDKINTDPQFTDSTRKLSKWDLNNGGAGTVDNALQEMLKMNNYGGTFNQAYSQSNLINYIRQGFTPQNSLLDNAGDPADGSPDLGAVDFASGTPSNSSDVNNDGKVNVLDLVLVIRWQGKNSGQGDWNNYAHLDTNSDGKIDYNDAVTVVSSL